jgi:hypothetical protein
VSLRANLSLELLGALVEGMQVLLGHEHVTAQHGIHRQCGRPAVAPLAALVVHAQDLLEREWYDHVELVKRHLLLGLKGADLSARLHQVLVHLLLPLHVPVVRALQLLHTA